MDFSTAALEARRQAFKNQENYIKNSEQNDLQPRFLGSKMINLERGFNQCIFRHSRSQDIYFHVFSLKKKLEDVLHQYGRINQERRRNVIQGVRDLTEGKENPR